MLTLEQMARVGREKLAARAPAMARNWDAAKGDMKAGYDATPFNALRKQNYKDGIDRAKYRPPDPDKWARSWTRKMG